MLFKLRLLLLSALLTFCGELGLKPSFGVEINCDSPVFRESEQCAEEKANKKPAEFDSWFPIGINENRIAVSWVQLKSYKELNENSYRLRAKFTYDNYGQVVGKLDVNCKNKDYYFRPQGVLFQGSPWAAIPKGSGIEAVANYFCKRTSAKSEWGYTEQTSYLWNKPDPMGDPANSLGEWVLHYDRDDAEGYYNTDVKKDGNSVIYATFTRLKKGDRSAANPGDTSKYHWINNSCIENLGSVFYQPDISVAGEWLAPVPGRPGGTNMEVRKKYCQ
mgnify:CR=1 FL=1